jgi:hypothetical protein
LILWKEKPLQLRAICDETAEAQKWPPDGEDIGVRRVAVRDFGRLLKPAHSSLR